MNNKIKIFQIDTFSNSLFGGNPAAVCPLNCWLEDDVLQQIAIENNMSETAFFVQLDKNRFHLRWFTPECEMDLCGHATLASAYVIFEELGFCGHKIEFKTQSGWLTVGKNDDMFTLDFPSRPAEKCELPKIIAEGLNIQPKEVWKARDYLLLFDNEEDVNNVKPNQAILNQINLDPGGIIVTAPGTADGVDFVSRFFTPQASIFEDPVTGSAHCTLIPFWAARLNKTKLRALQLSKRGGELFCTLKGDRVEMSGKAIKYLQGTIEM